MGEVVSASVAIDGSGKAAEVKAEEVVVQPKAGEAGEVVVEEKVGGEAEVVEEPKHPAQALKDAEPVKPPKTEQQQDLEARTGLDLDPYSEEWHRDGKLSEKSYGELEAAGLSKKTVNTIIRGLQADAVSQLREIAEVVGGDANYNRIMTWAKGVLTDGEKHAAVAAMTGGGDGAKVFLQGLQARFVEANGSAPRKRSGGGGGPKDDVFESRADQAKAMGDPRYRSDAKYRDGVVSKSIRSFAESGSKKRTKASPKSSRRAPKAKR